MGIFSVPCVASGIAITYENPVMLFLLRKTEPKSHEIALFPNNTKEYAKYVLACPPLSGCYNGYGWVDKFKDVKYKEIVEKYYHQSIEKLCEGEDLGCCLMLQEVWEYLSRDMQDIPDSEYWRLLGVIDECFLQGKVCFNAFSTLTRTLYVQKDIEFETLLRKTYRTIYRMRKFGMDLRPVMIDRYPQQFGGYEDHLDAMRIFVRILEEKAKVQLE